MHYATIAAAVTAATATAAAATLATSTAVVVPNAPSNTEDYAEDVVEEGIVVKFAIAERMNQILACIQKHPTGVTRATVAKEAGFKGLKASFPKLRGS
jgi:hypothetical protein